MQTVFFKEPLNPGLNRNFKSIKDQVEEFHNENEDVVIVSNTTFYDRIDETTTLVYFYHQ